MSRTARVTSLSHESDWQHIGIGWSHNEYKRHAFISAGIPGAPKAKNRAELEYYF